MLKKFSVKGFRNFEKEIEFDLSAGGYDFNSNAVKNKIVKNAIIFGPNGAGKSNFGYALFDIVLNLTDKEKRPEKYANFLNFDTLDKHVEFTYTFIFDNTEIEYKYIKENVNLILYERLKFGNKVIVEWDRTKKIPIKFELEGASKLNLTTFQGNISFVKWIYRGASFDLRKKECKLFNKMFDFVERMLLFKSLRFNEYIGFTNGSENIDRAIIEAGKLKDFEEFLRKYGVNYQLEPGPNHDFIVCKFKKVRTLFESVMSTGTDALRLFFYWKMKLEKVSFVFIDEFDAFYHWDVAIDIIKNLRDMKDLQCVITTHNTDNMDNDVLRPDCYYILKNKDMKSVNNCTDKELREVHNLQKLYRSGKFNGAFKNE